MSSNKKPNYYIIQLDTGHKMRSVLYGPQTRVRDLISQFHFYNNIVRMPNVKIVREVADEQTL